MQPIWTAGIFVEPNAFYFDSRRFTGFLVKGSRMVMSNVNESPNVIYVNVVRKKNNRSNSAYFHLEPVV